MTNFDNLPKEFIQRVALTAQILEKFKTIPHSIRHYQAYEKDEDFMDKLNIVKLNSQKEDKNGRKLTNKENAKRGEKNSARAYERLKVGFNTVLTVRD